VAAALPPDAALVDFVQYSHYTPPAKSKRPPQREQRLLAFVLTRGRPPTCIPLGPADPLGQAAHAWRRDLLKPGAAADQSGAAVAERVWGPLRAHLGEAAARSATYSEDVESPGLFFNGFPWAAPTARASIAGRNPCRVSIARGAGQVIAGLRQGLATAAGRPSALCAGFRASVMALRAADAMGRRRLRQPLEPAEAHVVFVDALPVGEMAQLHGPHCAVGAQRQPGSQTLPSPERDYVALPQSAP
jgi:hypothetical protein